MKKIKKIATSIGILGKILNSKSNSTENTYSCDYINKLHNYSLEEQAIGTWIDGKPLYRKVVGIESLPNNEALIQNHNISGIDNIININGFATNGTEFRPIPFNSATANRIDIQITADRTSIYFRTNIDVSAFHAYIILEYTRTTD